MRSVAGIFFRFILMDLEVGRDTILFFMAFNCVFFVCRLAGLGAAVFLMGRIKSISSIFSPRPYINLSLMYIVICSNILMS